MLIPFDITNPDSNNVMKHYPVLETEIFRLGSEFIDLNNGNILKIMDNNAKEMKVRGKIIRPNCYGRTKVLDPRDLLEDKWILVDNEFMKRIGIPSNKALALWTIMDSMVVKTDLSKTSCLVLGNNFDVGLRFFKALHTYESKLMMVTDLVKLLKKPQLEKGEKVSPTTFITSKDRTKHAYDVYISPLGLDIIQKYLEKFPQLKEYLLKNVDEWKRKSNIPRSHYIKKIFHAKENNDNYDPNVELFGIYQWVLNKETSGLPLTSALSMNASSDNLKKIDLELTKNMKPVASDDKTDTVTVDKNMAIVNNPNQFVVGTSFEKHPSYPKLGNRVVFISNTDPHIPFGKIGTVIGVYKSDIEILFDESFIGANNLCGRCEDFRGGIVSFLEIFDLTGWRDYVNSKEKVAIKMKTILEKKNKGMKLQKHELIDEWNGEIDKFLLINQMFENKEEIKKQKQVFQSKLKKPSNNQFDTNQQPQSSKPYVQQQTGSQQYYQSHPNAPQYPQNVPMQRGIYYQQQPYQSTTSDRPNIQAPAALNELFNTGDSKKFESNPTHKLKSKKDIKDIPDAEELERRQTGKAPKQKKKLSKKSQPLDAAEFEKSYKPKGGQTEYTYVAVPTPQPVAAPKPQKPDNELDLSKIPNAEDLEKTQKK